MNTVFVILTILGIVGSLYSYNEMKKYIKEYEGKIMNEDITNSLQHKTRIFSCWIIF